MESQLISQLTTFHHLAPNGRWPTNMRHRFGKKEEVPNLCPRKRVPEMNRQDQDTIHLDSGPKTRFLLGFGSQISILDN